MLHTFIYDSILFFFNDTATTEIYTLSLHDALPISWVGHSEEHLRGAIHYLPVIGLLVGCTGDRKSTRLIQSPCNLVCRLLLEKKKMINQLEDAVVTETYACVSLEYICICAVSHYQ